LLLSLMLGGRITDAQAMQPTGQISSPTDNPQSQSAHNLVAPITFLQGSTESQVLGITLNQLTGKSMKLTANNSGESQPTFGQDELAHTLEQASPNRYLISKKVLFAGITVTALMGLFAVYLASRHRLIDSL
jgi:hypothetical protein